MPEGAWQQKALEEFARHWKVMWLVNSWGQPPTPPLLPGLGRGPLRTHLPPQSAADLLTGPNRRPTNLLEKAMSAAGTPSGGSYSKAHRFRSCGTRTSGKCSFF